MSKTINFNKGWGLNSRPPAFQLYLLACRSVADPKVLISDPDPTCQVTDPDPQPTLEVVTEPYPTCQVISDPDPDR